MPHQRHAQLDGGTPVQPDVQDGGGLYGRWRFDHLLASRDGSGYFRELPECAEDGSHETALRYRTDRKGIP